MDHVSGLDDLDDVINDLVRKLDGPDLDRLAAIAGDEIFKEVAARAPVRSGQLKASIESVTTEKKHRASFSIQVADSYRGGIRHYAVFIEYGHVITRKARTRAQRRNNAAYEHVPAQPFMRPAFDVAAPRAVEKFEDALNRILVEKLRGR